MARPLHGEYAPFYENYIGLAEGKNVQELITCYSDDLSYFINNLPEDKADFAYARGKWTVKDLVQHLIDAERVFTYRATRFSRKDTMHLSGFDENAYAANAGASARSLQNLKDEFTALRKSTDLLLQSFSGEQLSMKGTANNYPITVNALAFVIFGHIIHHRQIMEERYLNA
jgi:uncharacterized damage-inducible protein DinB